MSNDIYSRNSTEIPDHIMLSISDDPATTATISFRTNTMVTKATVEYWTNNSERLSATAEYKKIKSDIDESNYFTVKVTNLSPDTNYNYVIKTDNYKSKAYTFTTAPVDCDEFKFIILSDHQNSEPHALPEYKPVRRLLDKILPEHPDCKFIFTVGDNCDNGENEAQWNGMFYGLKGIIESMPYMMSTGNHDNRGYENYYTDEGKFYAEHADFFDAQFEKTYPFNGPKGFETENYSFDYGNVHFVMLGINEPQLVNDWAYKDITTSDKTWKFAAYHFPIYPVMPEGQNDDGYPMMQQCIENSGLDVLFSGHEHSLARSFPIKNYGMYDKPSEGFVNYIAGNSGANIFSSNAPKTWHSFFYPQEEPLAMCTIVEIKKNKAKFTAVLEDGRIADEFIIDKDADTIYPRHLAPIYHRTKLMYKGDMPEMATRDCYPENINGEWYIPLGGFFSFIGAKNVKDNNKLTVSVFGKEAEFTEGTDIMKTSDGKEIKLSGKVYRHEKGQLYVTVNPTLEYFDMQWHYWERNNILGIESPLEDRTQYKNI